MKNGALRVAWYRLRATFGHRWAGYLSLVLLIGLVGGLALGGFAAARRTQASYTTYLAGTNPSDLDATVYSGVQSIGSGPKSTTTLTSRISHLAHVRSSKVGMVLNGFPLGSGGTPRLDTAGKVYPVASVNGTFFDQDRVTAVAGRMADPNRVDEVMMSASGARLLGYHLGDLVSYGFYTDEQESSPSFGTPALRPDIRVDARLVGLVDFNSSIVEDDIDRFPTFAVFTPALAKEVLARTTPSVSYSDATTYSLVIDGGSRDVPRVEREVTHLVPASTSFTVHAVAPVTAKADRSLKPISIALGMFGAVALLAALLIATQGMSRRLRESAGDASVLRAVGATPWVTGADALLGVIAAIVVGSLLAAVIAVALSPAAPLGPVRAVYPGRGIHIDWTVLGLGLVVLIGCLGAIAVGLAYRAAPHRTAQRSRRAPATGSSVVGAVAAAGAPAPAVVGVRMALEPGSGRTAVPVRSALLGTALAVALVMATVIFGSSLQTLVNHPDLYGWNWTYMLNQVGSGSAGVPPQAITLLRHDPDVAAATGVDYDEIAIDGQDVPALFGHPSMAPAPPVLSGHGLATRGQIELGAATMAQLHQHLGGTVVVSYGIPKDAPAYIPPTPLKVVGTSTMPAVGFASVVSDHTSMGTGAIVANSIIPPAFQNFVGSSQYQTLNGPNLVLVRLRAGVPAAAGLGDLQRIAGAANRDFVEVPDGAGLGNRIVVEGVQRPAEIVDYKTIGVTPTLLVAALAVGAVAALALTLAASVRRRRRDLALLKTLGFTQRQLAAAVAWQASVSAVVGVVIGIPVGIVLGRWLWDLFARQIYAVPEPTVPALSVVLIVVGTLVLANVVAAVPARMASRTPTAILLRAE